MQVIHDFAVELDDKHKFSPFHPENKSTTKIKFR